jgi:hypothetical protein
MCAAAPFAHLTSKSGYLVEEKGTDIVYKRTDNVKRGTDIVNKGTDIVNKRTDNVKRGTDIVNKGTDNVSAGRKRQVRWGLKEHGSLA